MQAFPFELEYYVNEAEAIIDGGKDMAKISSYQRDLIESLRDPCEAAAYLNAAIEEGGRYVFLLALRNVAEASGGMTALAEKANLSRESLYRMLSKRGNPEIKSLYTLLHAMGLRLAIEPESHTAKPHESGEAVSDLIHKRCWRAANPSAKKYQKDGGWTFRTGKPDCSLGCKWFAPLKEAEYDWGVCLCSNGPRAGMLTFEHMGCEKFRASRPDDLSRLQNR